MKLRTFKISFKLYYHEVCDWSSEYIRSKNKRTALRRFARLHKIKNADGDDPENWHWWEGDWYNTFRLIKEVAGKPQPCPHCDGAGAI